jgi:hypothetical protein
MLGVTYTITSQSGVTVAINDHSDPENVIALQEYPTFELEVRNEEIAKEGQHGIWDFYSFFGKRAIVFSGVIAGEDEAHVLALRDQLINATRLPLQPAEGDDGTVTISFTDPTGRDLQITGKLQSSISFRRNIRCPWRLDFQMVLKSLDTVFEGQAEESESAVRGYLSPSLHIPTALPLTVPEAYLGTFTVNNGGNAEANVRCRIYGSAAGVVNPFVLNVTTGKALTLALTLGDSEWAEFDTKLGTVESQDGDDLSGYLAAGSSFPTLIPGDNALVYAADPTVAAQNPLSTREDAVEEVSAAFRPASL